MKLKHFYLPALIGFIVLGIFFCREAGKSFDRFPGDKGRIYETWETENKSFKVKITAYHEVGTIMPGAFFVFESAPVGSNDWRPFLTDRADDPVSIPRERFHFVNDRTAYFYGYGEFLVTVNGGQYWSIWKPRLPEFDDKPVYWGIKEATIETDGTGKMKLERYDEQLEIFTKDFGQNWSRTSLR